MKNKMTLVIALMVPTFSALFAADNNNTMMAPKNNTMQQQMSPMGDCSQLTTDEQSFAAKLTSTNAMNFCSKMNPSQRQRAMQMTTTPDASGTMMNPNDAVQKVMQDNGMTQSRSGGACPVK